MTRLVASIVVLSLCVPLVGDTPRARIEVNPLSVVKGQQFTLGEVACFVGVDTTAQQRLSNVVLGTSPLPGLERTISREQVITRLRQHGFRPEHFEVVVPTPAVVRREAHQLSPQHLAEFAINHLRQSLNLPPEVEVVCDAPLRGVSIPNQQVTLIPSPPRQLGEGLYLITLQVAGEGSPSTSLAVRLRVRWNRTVVVAQRPLRSGEVVIAEAVALQTAPLATPDAKWATEVEQVVGKTLIRPLRAGQPVPLDALEEPPVVRRGQMVKLYLHLQGAVIETKAVALQDGKKGANIRLQVTDTRKTLTATVLDAETAILEVHQ